MTDQSYSYTIFDADLFPAAPRPGRVHFLEGGRAPKINVGPGEWYAGYKTVANGWADPIQAGPGEVCVRTRSWDGWSFSQYVVGPHAAVIEWLRAKNLHVLAEEVAAVVL